ncbi:hypothetical protein K3152_12575 [Qipengyuania sp. 1NDH17]|uniref:Uncharacterized protein n=1 Tax=Qipengyuania polymorpha TaxID=2867234 RepID=A0ABS7J3K6_9SPHN|nr:hypothetical protein [Qipengyuania polymorpha]MBX7459086.1 hypothetical protein [Qipengyuania polymorpha]
MSDIDFSKYRAFPCEEWAIDVRQRLSAAYRECRCALDGNYPRIFLTGIKLPPSVSQETYKQVSEAYRAEIEGEPEIAELLAQARSRGIDIGWGGYSDPTGEEVSLEIVVTEDTEARLRDWLGTEGVG